MATTEVKENKMGTMPIQPLLLNMALPMMLSMLVQALYNIVDSIFVSRVSEDALTAVSLAFPVQNLMIAVGTGTGVGVNALLSRSLGEKNKTMVDKTANNAVILTIFSFVLCALFGIFGSRWFFMTQTDDPLLVEYGYNYLSIVMIFSFGLYGQLLCERLLQATGRTIYSMYTQGLGAILNIILDPIFIFGYFGIPAMGIRGAAIATVIGQIAALCVGIWMNIKKNPDIELRFKSMRPDFAVIGKIYSVGVPSIIMASIGSIMTYGMNIILLGFSSTAATVFGVYFKLQSFFFMPVFGLNNGMVPIVSYNYGARKKERMMQTFRLSLIYAFVLMAVGFIIMQIFPKQLFLMFEASEWMLSLGIPALRIISVSFRIAAFCIIFSSMFQALGNGMLSMIVSVCRQLVVLLPAAYLLSLSGDVNMVWWAFPIAEVISLALNIVFLRGIYNKVIKPL